MLAERLARYSAMLSYGDLPAGVVHEAKRRILDSLGCAFGAWNAAPCRIARRAAQGVTMPGGATLWGTTHRTLPELAVFANGTLIRYLDFNDTYLAKEPAHPSDNIAAVLAAGEYVGASGRRVLLGIALAYEIQCRLCDAAALRPRGWDHVTYGPFSTALSVAKVLNLSQARTLQAVNLAGVANVALRQTRVGEMSMWKACAFSNASRNGLFAALLAQQGMTGPAPIFEGEKGFMKLVSGPLDLPLLGGEAHDGPRRAPFKITETYIKHYPVEYHAQTAVEAALEVREEMIKANGPGILDKLAEIAIDSYDVAVEIIGRDPEKWRPQTRETADHSFPYCVSVALSDGKVTLRSFDAHRLADPRLQALMQLVRVRPHRDFERCYPRSMPTRITIRTKAGQTYRRQIDYPLGHPKQPMSDGQVEDKFVQLVGGRLPPARMKKVIAQVWRFEAVPDVRSFMPLLRLGG